MSTTNTNLANIVGVTPLEIYALKLLSHSGLTVGTIKEELLESLDEKGYVSLFYKDGDGNKHLYSVPKLTEQGRSLMAALNY